jgi:glycosyltransferase involved in cell wall biosynthesis
LGKPLKILCVIDSLGSGGAQRQMASLAIGLRKRGHEVEIFNYFPELDFFRLEVEKSGIPIHDVRKKKGFSFRTLIKLGLLLRSGKYHVALSFLNVPNAYLELAHFLKPSTAKVVSERSNHIGARALPGQRLLHRVASRVVVNSWSHCEWLKARHPWLEPKLRVIYNGVDTDLYNKTPVAPRDPNKLKLLAIGRVGPEKNVINMIKALVLFHDKWGWVPDLNWVGRKDESKEGHSYGNEINDLLEISPPAVQNSIHFLGEQGFIHEVLAEHDALIHPSLYEGMPNVICEALAAGKPVLASNVSDNGRLVKEGERGFLFDPNNPTLIASSIKQLSDLSSERWVGISDNCRKYSEETLSVNRLVSQYEDLFRQITSAK